MIASCPKCSQLFEPRHGTHVCGRCASFEELRAVAIALVDWSKKVDVVSGSAAAELLAGITLRAAVAIERAHST